MTTRLIGAFLLLLGPLAEAANFNFLQDSVFTRFTPEDTENFVEFVSTSLETANDKTVLEWRSKKSELRGKLKIDFSYMAGEIPCRRSLFLLGDERRVERFQFEICKHEAGWKIEDTAARHLSENDWTRLEAAGEQALSHTADGLPFSWHNATTGNSGVITAIRKDSISKQECRLLAITVFDKRDRSSNGNYWMCRTGEGQWQRQIRDDDFQLTPTH